MPADGKKESARLIWLHHATLLVNLLLECYSYWAPKTGLLFSDFRCVYNKLCQNDFLFAQW